MLNVNDMSRALIDLQNAKDEAEYAEERRQAHWNAYLAARERLDIANEALAVAERVVVREASRLAGQERRPNRDARRAQVMAGVDQAVAALMTDEPFDDIPF